MDLEGNIVLCGFMGCGKNTVGKRLAKLLQVKLCDLDTFVEQKAGMTVTEIFAKYGEQGFREREALAVEEISREKGLVVASGGGTVLFSRNVERFHEGGGKIFLLDVPLAALQERLKNDKKRPLLQKPNRRQVIEELYTQRDPLYRGAADVIVDAGAPASVVARRIRDMIESGL